MCGLVALWDRQAATSADDLRAACTRMRDTLVHRGPDDADTWVDPARGVALGHRRLSIIDLSPAGRQPMASPSGRWHVVFNGEIYNAEALRPELDGVAWRGHSDTEVLCAALDRWGLPATLQRLRGMFAIAAWDAEDRQLWLARDRLGQKPLYWHAGERHVLVGSELRALRVHPACPTELDRDALAEVVRVKCVHAPQTVLRRVEQVRPAGWVRLDADGGVTRGRYWDPEERARAAVAPASEDEALEELERLLTESVTLRTIADVPLGALLSGGIDSTLITALLVHAGIDVRTYTIGVDDPDLDEAPAAAGVARHLGTTHTTLALRPDDLRDLIPDLVRMQDEPFADSSLLPTALVSRLARQHVTVALAGDAGDELFGGYHRFTRTMHAWSLVGRVPGPARRLIQRSVRPVYGRFSDGGAHPVSRAGAHLLRRAMQIGSDDLADLYRRGLSAVHHPERYLVGAAPPSPAWLPDLDGHPVRRLMLHDLLHFLPDDILVKTDRASMAASLELRAPFLDHEVVGFALGLPADWTWAGGTGKHLLKRLLARHVPEPLWNRPKQGFGVPLDTWLRGPLRPWAEDLLSPEALGAHDLWNVPAVRKRWQAHLHGVDHRGFVWSVLQIQAWLRHDPAVGPQVP